MILYLIAYKVYEVVKMIIEALMAPSYKAYVRELSHELHIEFNVEQWPDMSHAAVMTVISKATELKTITWTFILNAYAFITPKAKEFVRTTEETRNKITPHIESAFTELHKQIDSSTQRETITVQAAKM